MTTKSVTIPETDPQTGSFTGKKITVTVPWICSHCGKPRGNEFTYQHPATNSFVSGWNNPCHIETYLNVEIQAQKYKYQNISEDELSKRITNAIGIAKGMAQPKGMTCSGKHCGEFFPHAEANQPNGTLLCYTCRKYPRYF